MSANSVDQVTGDQSDLFAQGPVEVSAFPADESIGEFSDNPTWEARIAELEAEVERLSSDSSLNNQRYEGIMGFIAGTQPQGSSSQNAGPNYRAVFPNMALDSQFILETGDGDFKLAIDGLLLFRYEFNHRSDDGTGTSDDEYGFNRVGTKINFRGHVFRDYSYWFRINLDGDTAFADSAVVVYHCSEDSNVAFGLFSSLLLREQATPLDKLQFIEVSPTNSVFDPTGYEGVMLTRHFDKFVVRGIVSDGYLAFSDVFENPDKADYALAGQLSWMAVGDKDDWGRFSNFTSRPGSDFAMLLNGAFHWQQGSTNIDPTGLPSDLFLGFFEASLEGDGWNAYSSFNYRYTDPGSEGIRADDIGFVFLAGAWLCEHVEGYSRFDMTIPDPDRIMESDEFKTATAGLAYYPFPESDNIKFSTEWLYMFDSEADSIVDPSRFTSVAPADGSQWVIRTQATIRW